MTEGELVEKVARAIYDAEWHSWEGVAEVIREFFRERAELAARELEDIWTEEGRLLPEGWRLTDRDAQWLERVTSTISIVPHTSNLPAPSRSPSRD